VEGGWRSCAARAVADAWGLAIEMRVVGSSAPGVEPPPMTDLPGRVSMEKGEGRAERRRAAKAVARAESVAGVALIIWRTGISSNAPRM